MLELKYQMIMMLIDCCYSLSKCYCAIDNLLSFLFLHRTLTFLWNWVAKTVDIGKYFCPASVSSLFRMVITSFYTSISCKVSLVKEAWMLKFLKKYQIFNQKWWLIRTELIRSILNIFRIFQLPTALLLPGCKYF